MPDALSPYQLLKSSRPQSPTWISDYDRRITQANAQPIEEQYLHALVPAQENTPLSDQKNALPPFKRTHYIADIHNRHAAALRHLPV
ncbi:MAG: hypothetical protein IKK34_04175 [Clostridia bacterium]|nr:hypothetical protein [Clostridia bacterium]